MTKANYLGINTLKHHIPNVKRNFYNLKRVHLCIYTINTISKIPFLEFLLYKYNDSYDNAYKNTICFPYFLHDNESGDDIIKLATSKVDDILKETDNKYNYDGYIYDNTELYIFFEIAIYDKAIILGDLKLTVNNFNNNTEYILGTIHEIVNLKQIINYKILSHVVHFFNKFQQFLFLYNDNNEKIDIPTIMYSGDKTQNINYRVFMGSSKNSSLAIFGPFYYLSQLKTALRYGIWDNYVKDGTTQYSNKYGKYKNGSLLRYVVFTKKMLVRMNNITDELDESFTTTQMIREKASAKKLQRISDRDASWSKTYDSIYAGIHPNIFDRGEMVAIKDLDNAVLLSIHNLDMKQFPGKKEDFDERVLNSVLIE